ncbi:MAG: methyltransferase domain-containing protein [Bacteroidetes bacterium]|nr:methyltransferase domain-containing protein [Bacteroidota bacterium]
MDQPGIPPDQLRENLLELDKLNRYLGGHYVTLQGVKKLLGEKNRVYKIVDIGCGSGDTLKYLARWARKHHYRFDLTGVDNNIHAIKHLKQHCKGFPEISGVVSDYKDYGQNGMMIDIYISSLFCHHLNNEALISLFRQFKMARRGFVINDLQRSPVAYYLVWLVTRILKGTELAKNDGPLSVRKAFTRNELEQLLQEASVRNYSIERKWNFRFLITVRNF